MSKRPRPQVNDYTVGWICALPVELAAAEGMLDEEHDKIPQDVDDTNLYTLGRIGAHNVVIASLPAGHMGTNPAATLASNLKAKFTSVKIGLMVGIGGGVPSDESDVRLGDVVISQPQNQHGGVVQYDFGKTGEGGRSIRTGFLNSPPPLLLSALARLHADQYRNPTDITKHLSVFDERSCFSREQAGVDMLFRAVSKHTGGTDCSGCSVEDVVHRAVRESREPKIHYGTIASGNQVMRDGSTRDRLCAELGGVLCFEMEAAGLMNIFPCLVIRGICDYADSHKNKTWQPYASATAAACAKELLNIVPVAGVTRAHMDIDSNTDLNAEQRRRYLEPLKFDQIEARRENIKKQHLKTCQWLLSKSEYQDWRNVDKMSQHYGLLWIKGKPGTGKSTIMKFAHAAAKRNWKDAIVLSFFFNARGENIEKSVEGMYRTLLLQLLEILPDLQFVFDVLGSKAPCDGETRTWNIEVLKDLLRRAVENLGERTVSCFIDALDECEEDQVRDMVTFFEDLGEIAVSSHIRLYTCFSSRHYPHITVSNSVQLVLEGQEGHAQDIGSYLHYELKAGRSKHIQDIKTEILERARGIFLWVILVVPILNKEYDRGRIHALRKRLDEIPDGLDELFNDILTRDGQNLDELILCIQWILYAKRPLKREELYYAMLVGLEHNNVTSWNPEEVTKEDMDRFLLSSSKGLAEVTRSKGYTVQFIHESVRDFLLRGNGLSRIQPSLKTNFQGVSHGRLRECCQLYMQIDLSEYLPLDKVLPDAKSTRATILRELSSQKFPFLEYAVHNVLEHADAADGCGLSQLAFVDTFAFNNWVVLDSLLEKHEVRRHTSDVSMLYIFAEHNLPNLIRTELTRLRSMDIPGERYGYPIIVALANRNEDAVKALLTPNCSESDEIHNHNFLCTPQELEEAIMHLLDHRDAIVSTRELTRASQTLIEYLLSQENANELLKVLLATKMTSPNPQQLMTTAVKSAELQKVESLLKAGVDYPLRFELFQVRDTPLKASTFGYEPAVEYLLTDGVIINTEGKEHDFIYYEALCVASEFGQTKIAELLIRKCAKVDVVVINGGLFGIPLSTASGQGHHETVALLLREGANPNAQDRQEHTGHHSALFAASKNDHRGVVDLLLRSGANANLHHEADSSTALYVAVINECQWIVELLLDYGADVDASGGLHGGALLAASYLGHEGIVKLLLDRGADINRIHEPHGSALTIAGRNGQSRIVKLLLNHGADVHSAGGYLDSALDAAMEKGLEQVAELLLTAGAEFVALDSRLSNLLATASSNGHVHLVKLLLRAGVDPNGQYCTDASALDRALERGNERIAELLIRAGARFSSDNQRALMEASLEAKRARASRYAISLDHQAILEISGDSPATKEIKDEPSVIYEISDGSPAIQEISDDSE